VHPIDEAWKLGTAVISARVPLKEGCKANVRTRPAGVYRDKLLRPLTSLDNFEFESLSRRYFRTPRASTQRQGSRIAWTASEATAKSIKRKERPGADSRQQRGDDARKHVDGAAREFQFRR
jgi:hypothetical protein